MRDTLPPELGLSRRAVQAHYAAARLAAQPL
jgi:hypothetical protein